MKTLFFRGDLVCQYDNDDYIERMSKGTCRLCGTVGKIQKSHVIPSFVIKWFKETSGSGYMRFGANPNKRVQDGYKFYWLCKSCEQRLNKWETDFAGQVFQPINRGEIKDINYDSWLLPFCVSVSWRVLNLVMEENPLDHFSEELKKQAEQAKKIWGEFLLGQRPHTEKHEQHILTLDYIKSRLGLDMPPNINRYVFRTIEMDAVCDGKRAFIYSKLGRFVILGLIEEPSPRLWDSRTKVNLNNGVLRKEKSILQELPGQFVKYFLSRAERTFEIYNEISETQHRKINETCKNNLDKLAESDTFNALDHDVKLFGKAAFRKKD